MQILLYPELIDIREIGEPTTIVGSIAESDACLRQHGGVAICLPADEDEEVELELDGWRGVFESEGWTYGERRMVCRPNPYNVNWGS